MNYEKPSATQKLAVWIAVLVTGGWLVYFVFAPTIGFDLLESWHNEQRVLQVVLLGCTGLSYLWLVLATPAQRIAGPLWVVLGLGAFSAYLADFPLHAAVELALATQLLVLGAFVATLVRSDPRLASLLLFYSAWLIGAVYVVGVAANYVGVVVEQRSVDPEVLLLGYANPRFASALHALILPLLAWLALDSSQRRSVRYSSWAIAALLCAINFALGTRAIWIALIAASVGLWWFGSNAGRRGVKAVWIPAIAGLAIFLLAWQFAPSMLPQTGAINSRVGGLLTSSDRIDLWQAAAKSVVAHPWFGIGPMNFASLQEPMGAHPHNWPLQIASEWGLPALTLVLLVVFRWLQALRAALRSRANAGDGNALPAICLSAFTAFVYGLVDGNWVMPVSQSLTVILVGASVGLMAREQVQIGRAFKFQSSATMGVAFATACALAWFTFQTVGLQLQREAEYVKRTHVQYFLPRFWLQGTIRAEEDE